MAIGLSVSDVVTVSINLSPTAAQPRNFGTMLVMGSSGVIDTNERIRNYTTLAGVASDFGTTAPEYLAAAAYFAQSPQPFQLKIGRWAQLATSGVMHGAVQSTFNQPALLASLQAVTAGAITITIDGTVRSLTGLNFSTALNLNGVASALATALASNATANWDGSRFNVVSSTTGASSSVGYGNTPSGTDIATLMGLTAASGASLPVVGIAAETAIAAVQALASLASDWYGLVITPASTALTDAQVLLNAAYIEGASPSRVYGHTITSAGVLDPTQTSDLASTLKSSGYSRTITQFSATNPYAVVSLLGRAFSVDFTGANTTITLKFKQEPGTIAETLSETQSATLMAKNVNVFVNYNNATAIIQQGVVASGRFFDEVHGLDWLSNQAQNDQYNVLYQSTTKVPQTDAGVHLLSTTLQATLARGVTNGLIAPGVWNAGGFGQLAQGDTLTNGFYVYAPPVSTQSQADREARKAPTLQAAVKLAGAIHSSNVILNINR